MDNPTEKITSLSSKSIPVAASKMFTYPTRLASAWRAEMMEINLPGYQLERPAIEISVRKDSTRSLGINTRNIYQKIYEKYAAPLQMDDEYILDSRYETDGNIAHIITNVVPRLLVAQKMCDRVTLVLRANASTMAKNIYKMLETPVLCTDKDVVGKLVVATDNDPGAYEGWYTSIFGNLVFEGCDRQTPERIFIARKGTRTLSNESEVEQILKGYGFSKVYFEDIPISEQWSVAINAKIVVALHGAAMSSLVFSNTGVKVIELFHPGYVVDMYRHMTNAVGGTWCGVTGQITQDVIKELDFNEKSRGFALTPTRIDPTSLYAALEYMGVSAK